jgi:hypothetical protein
MSEFDPKKVLAVRCPRCGALPGKPCITSKGNRTRTFHTLRKGVVYRQYLKSSRGTAKRGVRLAVIKITAVYLKAAGLPQQGEAKIDGERVIWERNGDRYVAWTMSEEEWERIETPPVSGEEYEDLKEIWMVMKARDPHHEFHHEDADWGAEA